MTPLVSVIVPTYRRPELLRRCLAALVVQSFAPGGFEIIVADDASSAETRAVVESFSVPEELLPAPAVGMSAENGVSQFVEPQARIAVGFQSAVAAIRYIPVSGNHGPAAARNAGLRAAAGEIIAFTDDDCIPAPDWLACGVAVIAAGADGVSGRVVVPVPDEPTDYEREQLGLARSDFITANCFYRRIVLESVGGFDERFPLAWREDSDLYFTLLERGYTLVRSAEPVVVHPIRPVRWGESLRQQRKTQYNALCYKKHPRLYRSRFQLRAPWFYYGAWLAAIGGLVGLVSRTIWLTRAGAAAYVVFSGWFTVKRLRGTRKEPRHVIEMVLTSLVIPILSVVWRLRGAWKYKVTYF